MVSYIAPIGQDLAQVKLLFASAEVTQVLDWKSAQF
jgi:hypothetical protein